MVAFQDLLVFGVRLFFWAHFWAARKRPKNRAFRSKSSDLPMQILWAFRYNPLRGLFPKLQA
jgi:hypothetical protein